MEPLHLRPGLHGESALPFCACQSNPASWKFKRGQKEADFKTHLCLPPLFFPRPSWLLIWAPWGTLLPPACPRQSPNHTDLGQRPRAG